MRTLVNEMQAPGPKSVLWDGNRNAGGPVASGMYVYKLEAAGQKRSGKLILLK